MCGRTTIGVNKKALEKYYHATMSGDFLPTYNASPAQMLPVVKNTSQKKIENAKWGFLPSWLKEKNPQGFINAKAETVFTKPSFRNAIVSRRCLVPADGFYEWKKTEKKKIPYYITLKGSPLFSLAGLWELTKDKDGNLITTYLIITTEPNSLMKDIHDRMPVILSPEEEKDWLQETSIAKIQQFLDPFSEKEMIAYQVSEKVNSPINNSKECIAPLA